MDSDLLICPALKITLVLNDLPLCEEQRKLTRGRVRTVRTVDQVASNL